MIKPCTCSHEYQDKRYGPGNRVMNPGTTNKKPRLYTCTVCGKVYNENEDAKSKERS